jgi:hypothetical protein
VSGSGRVTIQTLAIKLMIFTTIIFARST